MTPKPTAAIVGMGDAYASMQDRKDPIQLAVAATHKALADAGITKDQVDAVFTGRSPGLTSVRSGAIYSARTCICR